MHEIWPENVQESGFALAQRPLGDWFVLPALQRNTDAARAELDGPVQCRRFRTRDLPEATITTAAVAAALTTTTLTSALSASAISSSALATASVAPALATAALATSIAALATT